MGTTRVKPTFVSENLALRAWNARCFYCRCGRHHDFPVLPPKAELPYTYRVLGATKTIDKDAKVVQCDCGLVTRKERPRRGLKPPAGP